MGVWGAALLRPGDAAQGGQGAQSILPRAVPRPHRHGGGRGCCRGVVAGRCPHAGSSQKCHSPAVGTCSAAEAVGSLPGGFAGCSPSPSSAALRGLWGTGRGAQGGDGMKSKGGLRETGGGGGGG